MKKIDNILYNICESEHSSCNNACPVYKLNGGTQPGKEKPFEENRGCDCFKCGSDMRKFIEGKLGRKLNIKDFTADVTYYSNL